jgi:hypothetical protein
MTDRTLLLLRVLQSAAEDIAGDLPDQVVSAYVARDVGSEPHVAGEEQLRLVVTPRAFDRLVTRGAIVAERALQLSRGWRAVAKFDSGWNEVPAIVVSATYPACPFWWRAPNEDALGAERVPGNLRVLR